VGREPERGVAHWFFEQGASSPFPSPPLCGREGIHVNRKFLGVFTDILLLLVLIVSLGLSTSALAAEKPNIIFLLTDDMGYGDCGCYGGKFVPTPNIDRLAKEGTKFTQFYAMAPVCSPSRTGFLTGTFPARWRITTFLQTRAGNRASEQVDFLDPKAPSIARTLKANGYATGHFGKWHMGGGRDVTNAPLFAAYGFDEHAGTYESPEPDRTITATNWIFSQYDKVKRWDRSAYFVDKTLDFLRRHKGKPCYVNLWPDDVHTPWIPEGTDIANRRRENDEGIRDAMLGQDRDGIGAQSKDGSDPDVEQAREADDQRHRQRQQSVDQVHRGSLRHASADYQRYECQHDQHDRHARPQAIQRSRPVRG